MKIFLILILLFSAAVITASAQEKAPTILEKRAADVASIINAPEDFEKIFTAHFLSNVPPAKFSESFENLTATYGKTVKVVKVNPIDEYSGSFEILFEKGVIAKMNIVLDKVAPNLINGLLVTAIEKSTNSLEDIVSELKKLPGNTGFTVVKLDGKDFTPIISYNADKPFAIGSAFKLYVLAELIRSIEAGERKWSDVVQLTENSFPSGQIQNWEQGSPVTLHTLAAMMISISDNTATDQLIEILGREKIEKILTTAGNANPKMSVPFLKTVEMFKIKGAVKENYAEIYVKRDLSGKRAMLGKEIAAFEKDQIDFSFLAKPKNISNIEWFASPDDLARLMNWLRLNTAKSSAELGRGVLAINSVLPEAESWSYAGYKGGSETGVINMTWLLQSKKGDWFVVTGSWNNENAQVKNEEFALLMQKAVKILQEQTK